MTKRTAKLMTKRTAKLAALTALAAFGIAACSDGIFVNRSEAPTAYTGQDYVQYTATNGSNAVTVVNPPFDADRTVQAVLDGVHERYAGGQYRFFAGPPPQDWNGYTVKLAFAGGVLGNTNLCASPQQPLRPASPGKSELLGEYCYGGVLVTEAQGYTNAVSGPDDPRLKKLVGAVVAELFSYRVPHAQRHGSSNPPK